MYDLDPEGGFVRFLESLDVDDCRAIPNEDVQAHGFFRLDGVDVPVVQGRQPGKAAHRASGSIRFGKKLSRYGGRGSYPLWICFYREEPHARHMDALARLLGSSTRANVIRALTLSDSPLTAYRIARAYNMNVAKVYREMKNMVDLGLVEASDKERGVAYRLAQEDLRNLALKLSPGFITLQAWKSEGARRFRFRAGLGVLPGPRLRGAAGREFPRPDRLPGELESLARLGRKAFDSKYGKPRQRRIGAV